MLSSSPTLSFMLRPGLIPTFPYFILWTRLSGPTSVTIPQTPPCSSSCHNSVLISFTSYCSFMPFHPIIENSSIIPYLLQECQECIIVTLRRIPSPRFIFVFAVFAGFMQICFVHPCKIYTCSEIIPLESCQPVI